MSSYAGGVDRVLRSRLLDAASVGSFGILLGVIAFLLAIPPITSRSLTWSLLVGIFAILFGVAVAAQLEAVRAGVPEAQDHSKDPSSAAQPSSPREVTA